MPIILQGHLKGQTVCKNAELATSSSQKLPIWYLSLQLTVTPCSRSLQQTSYCKWSPIVQQMEVNNLAPEFSLHPASSMHRAAHYFKHNILFQTKIIASKTRTNCKAYLVSCPWVPRTAAEAWRAFRGSLIKKSSKTLLHSLGPTLQTCMHTAAHNSLLQTSPQDACSFSFLLSAAWHQLMAMCLC